MDKDVSIIIAYYEITGRVPSDGVEMRYSEVPTAGVLVVLVAVLLSVVFAAAIGIATVVYRNNKSVSLCLTSSSLLPSLGLYLIVFSTSSPFLYLSPLTSFFSLLAFLPSLPLDPLHPLSLLLPPSLNLTLYTSCLLSAGISRPPVLD